MNGIEFMKNLFLCMLFLTGILACFVIMMTLVLGSINANKKSKKMKIIEINGNDLLDEETEKELSKIAEKLAKKYVDEMTSDEYEKED